MAPAAMTMAGASSPPHSVVLVVVMGVVISAAEGNEKLLEEPISTQAAWCSVRSRVSLLYSDYTVPCSHLALMHQAESLSLGLASFVQKT